MKHLLTTLAAVALTSAAPAQTTGPNGWIVTDQISPLTGARTLAASIDSTNQLLNMLGRPARAALVIRCGEGGLSVYVSWPQVVSYDGQNMMGQPKTFAIWRIDDGKLQSNLWSRDTTGTAAGEFQSRNAGKLLSSIAGARKLAVRLTGQQTQDAQFDLAGIEKIAADATAACGRDARR